MGDWKSLDAFKAELLKDDEFRARFMAGEPDYLVAREIIAARKAAGMSQEALARSIGTSQSRISKWERGEETPRLDALYKIAAATNTEVRLALVHADRASRRRQRVAG
jgi:transcriptional regulator with XRE-family HTH domain